VPSPFVTTFTPEPGSVCALRPNLARKSAVFRAAFCLRASCSYQGRAEEGWILTGWFVVGCVLTAPNEVEPVVPIGAVEVGLSVTPEICLPVPDSMYVLDGSICDRSLICHPVPDSM